MYIIISIVLNILMLIMMRYACYTILVDALEKKEK